MEQGVQTEGWLGLPRPDIDGDDEGGSGAGEALLRMKKIDFGQLQGAVAGQPIAAAQSRTISAPFGNSIVVW